MGRIVALAVERWQITLVAVVMVVMLGISSFRSIPRSVDPHFPIAVNVVTIILPGADAQAMEETVAKPIEDVLQGLDHVREIRSTSSDGAAVISIEFEHGTDPEATLDRVVREVSGLRDRLPQGITRIAYRRPRTTEAAVMQLAVVSEGASWRRMVKYAEDMRDRLNTVPGVRQTVIEGAARPEVRVAIDAERLAQARIPASAVANAIRAGGVELPAGAVQAGGRRLNIDAGGAFRDLEAIRAVPVRAGDGRMLTVGDIATVSWSEAEQLHIARYNGQRALWVVVRQKDGVDAGTLKRALSQAVEQLQTSLPPDMKLAIAFDQSKDISRKLALLARDFGIALALVLITIMPLGFRPSLIVMLSIPLSLAMGITLLGLFGFTLNQISISGFILSLGLLVDDSIVVTENIERHIRDGDPPQSAAVNGTKEISAAVLGATGVLLFAFLPLTFMPEGSGDFVRGLPMAVLVTVASSLLVSLTVIPFVASRLLKHGTSGGNRLLQVLTGGIERFYAPILHRALDAPRRWFWGAMLLCVAALALVPVIGFSLFPKAETPYFLVRVETPEGSSLAQTEAAVRQVSSILGREPELVNRMENIGRGNPQIYYNILPREERARYGDIFVTLDEWNPRTSPAMIARLRERFATFADARVSIVEFESGPPIEASVAIRLSGPDLAELQRLSRLYEAEMRKVGGLRDIDNPLAFDRVDLDLGLDDAKASLLGVAPGEARRALRLAVSGEQASQLRDNEGDSWPVTVRLPMQGNQPISALDRVYVPTLAGGAVPLAQIATPRLVSVPPQITRYKLQRTVTLTAFTKPGVLSSRATAAVVERIDRLPLPPGYSYVLGGEAEASARSNAGLGPVILLALLGIFGVLVIEFGRFKETVVVAGVIPLGTFGGLVALWITGNSLSFLAIIGFVALIGIEIKNSILLVDFTNQLREEGVPLDDAIEQAGEIRFLPILLTSATAIGGLLPLAVQNIGLYSPMAWVIIGGLITSTLLARLVTPVMYKLIPPAGHEPKNIARGNQPDASGALL